MSELKDNSNISQHIETKESRSYIDTALNNSSWIYKQKQSSTNLQ